MADGLIGRIEAVTGDVSVEAENIVDTGFGVESHAAASGGKTVSLLGTGRADGRLSYDFEGEAGTYDLAITAHDEFDGASTLDVWINGARVGVFTLDGNTATPGVVTDGNRAVLTLDDLALGVGDTVEIRASQDGEEWVRIDRLDFIRQDDPLSPPPPPPPPPSTDGATIGIGDTQAEALDLGGGFEIETRGDASGNALVRTLGDTGTASGTFTGPAGSYEIDVTYFDESDGTAAFALLVNGVSVADWRGEGGVTALGTASVETVTLRLEPGDVITVRGEKGGEELARVDALTVTPAGPAEPDNAAPDVGRPIANQTGAEGIPFSFTVPNNTFTDADGDPLTLTARLADGRDLPGWLRFDGEARTFSGTPADGDDGTLAITVTASDGRASTSDTFELAVADMGDVPARLLVGVNEAEELTLDGYVIENRNSASSSQLIRTFSEGEVTGQFDGPAGRYRLDLVYQEESDGKSDYAVFVNGSEVLDFKAEKGARALGTDALASVEIDLQPGDVVTVRGSRDVEALARVDTITLTALGSEPDNRAPVATGESVSTDEDVAITVDVVGNDSDPDGDELMLTGVSGAGNGVVTLAGDGNVTYTPDADFNGADSFTYSLADGRGGTATATVSVTVVPLNDAPIAITDSLSVEEDSVATGMLAASDVDGDALSFSLASGGDPVNGTVVIDPDGEFLYEPDPDFVGADSFTYTVSDGAASVSQTVTVSVGATDDSPIAQDDFASTQEDVAITVDVLANDSDPDGDALVLTETTGASNGTVAIGADGSLTYTPDADFNGSDVISYTVSDGEFTDTAFLNVAVTAVNDAPVAQDDMASTVAGGAITVDVLANDGDVDGDALAVTSVEGIGVGTPGDTVSVTGGEVALNADGTLSFTADVDFSGTAVFSYTVSDGDAADQADVSVSVEGASGEAPVAFDFVVGGQIPVDTVVEFSASDIVAELATDADSDLTTASITFTGATIGGTPITSLSTAGFAFAPQTDIAGGFTIDTGASGFSLLAEDAAVEVVIDFTVTDGVNTDQGTIAFTVSGEPGDYDLAILYLGPNVPGNVLVAEASVGAGEAQADVQFTGQSGLRDIAAVIDVSDTITDFVSDFAGSSLSGAYAYAEDESTARTTVEVAQQSFTGVLGGTAIATGGSEVDVLTDNLSLAFARADDLSEVTTTVTEGSSARAVASSNSTAVVFVMNESEADLVASGGSESAAIATDGSRAVVDVRDGSLAIAEATAQSEAFAFALENGNATSRADNGSVAETFAGFSSVSAAVATDGSLAVAESERSSIARADAMDGSGAIAVAEQTSSVDVDASGGGVGIGQGISNDEIDVVLTSGANGPIDPSFGSPSVAAFQAAIELRADNAGLFTSADTLFVDLSAATGIDPFAAQAGATSAFSLLVLPEGGGSSIQGVEVSGLPAGSVLSAGMSNGDGTVWTFMGAPPEDLTLTTPLSTSGDFDVTITLTTENGTASVTKALSVGADPVLSVLGAQQGIQAIERAAPPTDEATAIGLADGEALMAMAQAMLPPVASSDVSRPAPMLDLADALAGWIDDTPMGLDGALFSAASVPAHGATATGSVPDLLDGLPSLVADMTSADLLVDDGYWG